MVRHGRGYHTTSHPTPPDDLTLRAVGGKEEKVSAEEGAEGDGGGARKKAEQNAESVRCGEGVYGANRDGGAG